MPIDWERYRSVMEPMAVASAISVFDLLLALVVFLFDPTRNVYFIASDALFLEFGVMLVLGACFMSREPISEAARQKADGTPTTSWRLSQLGKKILYSTVFVFLFGLLFVIVGYALK
ncbi:MAG: hypothetical protein HXY34_05505 [Candidatus Thorarchaeota archaeon]|nr:hypothetical protein [Candidatus Thorarchaeota archaeon]